MKIYLNLTNGERKCVDQIENGNRPYDDIFKSLTRTAVRAKMLDDLNVTASNTDRETRAIVIMFSDDLFSSPNIRCFIYISRMSASKTGRIFKLVIIYDGIKDGPWYTVDNLTEAELLRFTVDPKMLMERFNTNYPRHMDSFKSLKSWDDIAREARV